MSVVAAAAAATFALLVPGPTRANAAPQADGPTARADGGSATPAPRPSARSRVSGRALRRRAAVGTAVPVLLYHRIAGNGPSDGSAGTFAAQMDRLRELGFTAISLREYVRFMRGEPVDLPPHPILITFDDGYTSALTDADPVLARMGWSAAMYVPTAAVGQSGHLTWADLRAMEASGRWQVDEHAGEGHVLVTADSSGRRLPYYAAELWVNGAQESFDDYRERVRGDVEQGLSELAANLPGWRSYGSFAVPFNNYGQHGSNDPRIAPWLSGYLMSRFAVVFVQRDDGFTTAGQRLANRIAVSSGWDPDTLEAHLSEGAGLPTPAARAAGRRTVTRAVPPRDS